MSDVDPRETRTQPLDDGLRIDAVCDRFEADRRVGRRPRIEDYLGEVNETGRPRLLRELVALEVELRLHDKETVTAAEYLARFPALDAHWLSTLVAASPKNGAVPSTRARKIRCPHCHNPINLIEDKSDEVLCPGCGSSFTVRDARHTDTTTGTRPLGKYQLLERVGLGAFGAVWKARDTELDRIVALKIPHTGLLTNDADLERFKREARAAAQLRHPGIVTVYDVETLDGLPTIVADFISGMPLRDLLQTRRLTFHEAATLLADIAEAVHYAHTLRVVHRDLKPANILISFSRRSRSGAGMSSTESEVVHGDEPARLREPGLNEMTPLITDFGLALRDEAEVTMTLDGHIIGTPAYMSPEQAAGRGHAADARSDVYSLGVIFYELLTAELPFRGSRVAMITQVMHEEPRPPRKVKDKIPRDLETVCLKCLRKEPGRRYQTARELAEDLRRWLGGEPVQARPVGALERGWRWCRRNPAVAAMAAAVVVALLAGTAGASYFALREANRAIEASENLEKAREARRKSDRLRYFSDMRLAQRAWEDNRIDRLRELLGEYDSTKIEAEEDLRGFEWHYWWRRSHPTHVVLSAHSESIDCVAFSPDGRYLATASRKNPTKIWDAASGVILLSLRDEMKYHVNDIMGVWSHRQLAFSPDSSRLATASVRQLTVWDTATGRELLTVKTQANDVAFSPDGCRLVTVSPIQITMWEASTGKELLTVKTGANAVAFSPSGRHIATASFEGPSQVWDAVTGQELFPLTGHKESVTAVAYSPDGRFIATSCVDCTGRVWDGVTGKEILILRGHTRPVTGLAFSPDGRELATVSADRTACIWNAATGQQLLTIKGHTDGLTDVDFDPDGCRVATASHDKTARVWNLRMPLEMLTVKGHRGFVRSVGFSPDGRRLATTAFNDDSAYVVDAVTGQRVLTLKGFFSIRVAFSPDGSRIATASNDGTARLWDAVTGQELLILKEKGGGAAGGVAFSPDGRRLATAFSSENVHLARVWDAVTGKELLTLQGLTSSVNNLVFSPDGSRIATAFNDRTPQVWDAATGQELFTLRGHTDGVNNVMYSPDGSRIATGSDDSTARLWDSATGKELLTLKGHTDAVLDVSFSPDGRRLATASRDGTARVWETDAGYELLLLNDHSVNAVSFSPDGRRLATVSGKDHAVRVWETEFLSPEQGRARFLVGVVRSMWEDVQTRDELLKRIREDKLLSDDERKQALTLAEQYPEKK